jgi:hypothetical protein
MNTASPSHGPYEIQWSTFDVVHKALSCETYLNWSVVSNFFGFFGQHSQMKWPPIRLPGDALTSLTVAVFCCEVGAWSSDGEMYSGESLLEDMLVMLLPVTDSPTEEFRLTLE